MEKTSFKDWVLRAISVLGLVAILLIGVWGIIQITLAVPGFFNSFNDSATTTSNAEEGTADTTVLPETSVAKKTTTSQKTTNVVANKTATLYDLPNLIVYINSAMLSAPGRFAVQFTVANLGTNVAPNGWMFWAALPLGKTHPYISSPQKALYPGDKVVYTLGFNIPMPTYTSPYIPYMSQNDCGYYVQSYTYNGAYNIENDPIYKCANSYTIPYQRNQPYERSTFGIVIDPQNFVQETNEADNAASTQLN